MCPTPNADETAAIKSAAVKNAIEETQATSPEVNANIFSKIFFGWPTPLFRRATSLHKEGKALQQDDLFTLPPYDMGQAIAPIFEKAWHAQDPQTASLRNTLPSVVGKRFLWAGLLKFINSIIQFAFPFLLRGILVFIEETQLRGATGGEAQNDPNLAWYDKYRGYWLSALLFLAMASKALFENSYFHNMVRCSYHARVAMSVAVYNKALRMTSAERHGTTLGELTNLMQVDSEKIAMFFLFMHTVWDGALQIFGYIAVLYTLIGWPCFVGLGVMILAGPVQGIIMKKLFGQNRMMVKHTDARVKTTNEAVQGIRSVKMYTWEENFQKGINESRSIELDFLKKIAYLRGFSRAYMGALPGITAVVSFVVYALVSDGNISASTLFAALVAFNQLRFPLLFYPMALAQWAQASVSAKRIEAFLRMKEIDSGIDSENEKPAKASTSQTKKFDRDDASLKTGEIEVNDVTFFWGDPNTPIAAADTDDHSSLDGSRHSKSSKKSIKTGKEDAEDSEGQTEELRYPQAILKNVSLSVAPGEICAIVGRVGSGKTTLCSGILNEAVIDSGSISMKGKVAYAAQSAWILNATVRDNITFGLPYEQKKYDGIIRACQLTHDLDLLDAGDMTEIGENGINLSGGQKQRISIARAAYSDADIIVLDDPLSALDPEVGKNLFDECIIRIMKGKTRIFVTNQLQCLKYCDTVVALGQNRVIEQGTFDELSNNDGEVQKLLDELKSSENESAESSGRVRSDSTASAGETKGDSPVLEKGKDDADVLVKEEERNIGAVAWKVYKKYIMAGGGFGWFFFAYFMFVLCAAVDLLSTAWITFWTSDANYERQPQEFYLGFYALTAVLLGVFQFFRSWVLARFGVRASNEIHKSVLDSVIRAPMSFFDTTPTGRILSRFSKDLYSIDIELSEQLDFFLFCSLTVLVSLGTILVITPWFGVAILPIGFFYIRALNFFREVSRETKRLESISRSPMFAHFSETLGGLGTIRAYGQSNRFISDFETKIDLNTRAYYNNRSADRWLSVRLEILGSLIAGLAGVFATHVVLSNASSATASSSNFSSVAGLSLNYAISVTGLLNWVVRSFAQMEAAMNAVERISYYTEEIPQEAPAKWQELSDTSSSDDDSDTPSPSSVAVRKNGAENPGSDWPSQGRIVLKNLMMKYRSETPLVIKGLDVEIKGGSRVGVVGRTGSGKSSLLLTLLRIVEPHLEDSEYEAPITVDGVDILRIGLTDLRSKIAIIPQNPVLFSGTIRNNMDPFNEFTDEEIWDSLKGCGMKLYVEEMPGLLDGPVAEYGENLSQGQRQLLCLGRALLKHCRILLLDEATSSVDYQTDKEIQRTIRESFDGCTVLTIAHRVNTIMDSDMILVMKDGQVGEYAPPDELLADSTSIFADIVKHSQTKSD